MTRSKFALTLKDSRPVAVSRRGEEGRVSDADVAGGGGEHRGTDLPPGHHEAPGRAPEDATERVGTEALVAHKRETPFQA